MSTTAPIAPGPRDALPLSRSVGEAMARGFGQHCPACGKGALYERFLKVADACPVCAEPLHHHRADDAPPYFTILIVAHVVGMGIYLTAMNWSLPDWVQYALWLPLLVVLSLLLLPRIKGALVGLQWALRMHGFAGTEDTGTGSHAEAAAPLA